MLTRILNLLGWKREDLRIANLVSCQPPGNDLAPWQSAIDHCAVHREPVFAEGHPVVVPLGRHAINTVMGVSGKKTGPENWHGTITRDPTNRFWCVPTYHPSFLQRGAHNLIGTVLWDLKQALTAATEGRSKDESSLVIDPSIEWFRLWVDTVLAAVAQDPLAYPVSEDVETPDKASGRDEGTITPEDQSYQLLRVNVASHPDEGVTVPAIEPYLTEIRRLNHGIVRLGGQLWMWNKGYDVPRIIKADLIPEPCEHAVLDLMWLWHFLQSDLPRGLGFVASFYSTYGPWKHLADDNPGLYGAVDGLQNHRVGFGVIGDLIKLGMWEHAKRHVHQLHHMVLQPAQRVGVKIDRERLLIFKAELTEKAVRSLDQLEAVYPESLRLLSPKLGLVNRPAENLLHVKATAFTRKGTARKGKAVPEIKQDLYKRAVVVERLVEKEVWCCSTCGGDDLSAKHRCEDKTRTPEVSLCRRSLVRYFWQEPFNPDSWQQVLAYIKHRSHTPGKAKKSRKETTNRETLERLEKKHQDPFYRHLLNYRAVNKVKGTYVDGTERRLDSEDRVHPEPSFKPSTGRLSYLNPNITNVVADKEGAESLAAGFRKCVVASPGCKLIEVDFSGIEAVITAYKAGDPVGIRLAKLGIHAGLASHILKRPYDIRWSDADLGAYFKEIKESKDEKVLLCYDRSKRYIHARNYGLTIGGMVLQFPHLFPTHKVAESYDEIYRTMVPKIPAFQLAVQKRAAGKHYLGGPPSGDPLEDQWSHPWGYKHWFWSVYTYKKITTSQYYSILAKYRQKGLEPPVEIINGQYFKVSLGEDGKRALAFFGQAIGAGVLKEVELRSFDPTSNVYIGDTYFGKTPLRAPIHDSLLLEVPDRQIDQVLEKTLWSFLLPIVELPMKPEWGMGEFLSIGVGAKIGKDWQKMEKLKIPAFTELGVGTDVIPSPTFYSVNEEIEEQEAVEEMADLERKVS
jgi:uracil-DNA glycosylase family 4